MINFKIASLGDATFSVSLPEISLEFLEELKKLDFSNTSFVVCRSEGDQHEFRRCVYACELIRKYCPDSFIVVVDKGVLNDHPEEDLICKRRTLKRKIAEINVLLKTISQGDD